MTRVAFLVDRSHPRLWDDEVAILEPLAERGIEGVVVPWQDFDRSSVDAAVVRWPGRYFEEPEVFLSWIDETERVGLPLWNPPEVLRWNYDKRYLATLADEGVVVPKTEWISKGDGESLSDVLERNGWDRAVLKPVISAGGYRTSIVSRIFADEGQFADLLAAGDAMVQPFIEELVLEGEFSFMFFAGTFSHALLKTAAPGDFRVQHLYGGSIVPLDVAPADLLAEAEEVLAHMPEPWLYARIDGVRRNGHLMVMEIEAFEPVFYLGTSPGSPARFADALAKVL